MLPSFGSRIEPPPHSLRPLTSNPQMIVLPHCEGRWAGSSSQTIRPHTSRWQSKICKARPLMLHAPSTGDASTSRDNASAATRHIAIRVAMARAVCRRICRPAFVALAIGASLRLSDGSQGTRDRWRMAMVAKGKGRGDRTLTPGQSGEGGHLSLRVPHRPFGRPALDETSPYRPSPYRHGRACPGHPWPGQAWP